MKKHVKKRVVLSVIPTYRCNLKCKKCYRSGKQKGMRDLSFTEFTNIINRISREVEIEKITFTGGEPFIHSQINSMIEYTVKQCKLPVDIVTSGYFYDRVKKLLSTFKKVQLSKISFILSIDGDKETYMRLFGDKGARYHKNLLKTIHILHDYNVDPSAAVVILKYTLNVLNNNLLYIVKTLAITKVHIIRYIPMGIGAKYINDYWINENEIHSVVNMVRNFKKQYSNITFDMRRFTLHGFCPAKKNRVILDPDGKVKTCIGDSVECVDFFNPTTGQFQNSFLVAYKSAKKKFHNFTSKHKRPFKCSLLNLLSEKHDLLEEAENA